MIEQLRSRYNGDGTVTLIGVTTRHQVPFEVTVKVADLDRYNNEGILMQYAFPYLTSEQRELLISGHNNDEWEELFRKK